MCYNGGRLKEREVKNMMNLFVTNNNANFITLCKITSIICFPV